MAIKSPSATELAERRAANRERTLRMAKPGVGREQLAASNQQRDEIERKIARRPGDKGGP